MDALGAVHKQPNGRGELDVLAARTRRQARPAVGAATLSHRTAERFTTGSQNVHIRAGVSNRHRSAAHAGQVLAVVEDDQSASVFQLAPDDSKRLVMRRLDNAQGGADRVRNEPGIAERSQLGQPDAVRIVVLQLVSKLAGDARLANAARPV